MKPKKQKASNSKLKSQKDPDETAAESETSFPKVTDEAVEADPLKRQKPEPKQKPGDRLQDYLG